MSSLRSGCSLSSLSLFSSLRQATILRNTLTSFRLLSEFAGSVLSWLGLRCFDRRRLLFVRTNIRSLWRRLYLRRSFHTSCTNRMFSFSLSTSRSAWLRKLRRSFRSCNFWCWLLAFRKRSRLEFHPPRKLTLLHHVFD